MLKIRINLKINNSNASVRSLFGISKPEDLFNCFCNALLLVANVSRLCADGQIEKLHFHLVTLVNKCLTVSFRTERPLAYNRC